jgi:hypothetical protein
MNAKLYPVPGRAFALPGLLLWPLLLLLTGCPSGPAPVGKNTVDEIHRITTELGGKVDAVAANQNALIERQKELEIKTTQKVQIAANEVDSAFYVNARNLDNPYTRLTSEKLKTAASLLGQPTPDNAATNETQLALALSSSQQDQAKLRLLLEEERKNAKAAADARDLALQSVGAASAQASVATDDLRKTETLLNEAERKAKLAKAAADDAKAARDAELAAKTRLHIAYAFMGLGGLLIVAAVVATILHVPGVLAAGLAGGAALLAIGWLITVLEDLLHQLWFQISLGAVLLASLGVAVHLALRTWKTRRKATMDAAIGQGAIGAIQEAKNDDAKLGGQVYASLAPYLKEWFVDDQGKPDTAIEKEIDQRLQALNLRNPEGAEEHVLKALHGVLVKAEPARNGLAPRAPNPHVPPGGPG